MFLLMIISFLDLKAQESNKVSYHNFSLDIGYGYRLSSSPNEYFITQTKNSDYLNKVKKGLNLNFSYDFRYKPYLDFGFKASSYNSYSALSDSIGSKDDIYIFYIGPTIRYNFEINPKNNIYVRGTIGYMSFRNSLTEELNTGSAITGVSKTYRGNSLGMGLEIGYDYMINDFLSVGINSGIIGGEISNLKFGDKEFKLNQKENLYKFEINIGARIRL